MSDSVLNITEGDALHVTVAQHDNNEVIITALSENVVVVVTEAPVQLSASIENEIDVEVKVDEIIGNDGLTAYQIALNNGFVGTQQEWLLSLKGEMFWASTNW